MTTNSTLLHQPALRSNLSRQIVRTLAIVVLTAAMWRLSVIGAWPVAIVLIAVFELFGPWRSLRWQRVTVASARLIAGISASLLIALYPRALTQIIIAGLYLAWRLWLERHSERLANRHLVIALVSQAIAYEAIFMMAAIWDVPKIVIMMLVWLATYGCSYQLLAQRQDRAASLLAAAWALIASEVAWVCLSWLVSYTILQGFFIVPQPTIILTVMAYCFGSIYLAQRQNQLGRKRLTEYLIISLVIICIVILGTTWKGSL